MVPGEGRGADRRPGAPMSRVGPWSIVDYSEDRYALQLGELTIAGGLNRVSLLQLRMVISNELRDDTSTDARLAIALTKLEALTREIEQLAGRARRIQDGKP